MMKPVATAIVAITAILMPDLMLNVGRYPSMNRQTVAKTADIYFAFTGEKIRYGDNTIAPEVKYEPNIIRPEITGLSLCFIFPSISCASSSVKNAPAPMDIASTITTTSPVITIARLSLFAVVIPNNIPTVDTRLSSTPNIKFLIYTVFNFLSLFVKTIYNFLT